MREIKFRQYIGCTDNKFHLFGQVDGVWMAPCQFDYEKYPLEQYTGLKDKNGVEIYEGDIVKTSYDLNLGSYFEPEEEYGVWIGKVVISPYHGAHVRRTLVYQDSFMHDDLSELKPRIRKSTWRVKPKNCEVIGNIHENEDLIK